MADEPKSDSNPAARVAEQAERKPPSLLREFVDFVLHNKKWWLIPILVVLLLVGLLIVFGASSPLAPWIYAGF